MAYRPPSLIRWDRKALFDGYVMHSLPASLNRRLEGSPSTMVAANRLRASSLERRGEIRIAAVFRAGTACPGRQASRRQANVRYFRQLYFRRP